MRQEFKEIFSRQWEEMPPVKLTACLGTVVFVVFLIMVSEPGFVPVLDHANLAFHEAGHIFFGFFGHTLGLYGGTLGQLTFPLVAMVTFWWRRQPASFAISGIWFFENFFNIARYMADARVHVLPLVGGGSHDWTAIFNRWNAIEADIQVAQITRVLGWVGICVCVLFLAFRFWRDRKGRRISDKG